MCDWSRKLALLSQPIRCETETSHDLVARVLPRFSWVVSTLICHWLIKVFPCFWLADVIGLVWVIRHSIEKHFMYMLWSLEFEAYLKPLTTWRVIFVSALTFAIFLIQMNSQIFFFQIFSCNSYVRKDFWCCMKNHLHLITS